jgi:hypothetical protein
VLASPADYSSPISYIFSVSIANSTFIFGTECHSRLLNGIAHYSMDRVQGGIPLHLSKREVCFDDHKNFFGISDGTGNLLEHRTLPKEQSFMY